MTTRCGVEKMLMIEGIGSVCTGGGLIELMAFTSIGTPHVVAGQSDLQS